MTIIDKNVVKLISFIKSLKLVGKGVENSSGKFYEWKKIYSYTEPILSFVITIENSFPAGAFCEQLKVSIGCHWLLLGDIDMIGEEGVMHSIYSCNNHTAIFPDTSLYVPG